MVNALCHPDRLHIAKGKCSSCYYKDRYSVSRKNHWQLRYKLKKYGLTEDAYVLLLRKQKHRCAICNKKLTKNAGRAKHTGPHIDHNHKTGTPRGILCNTCNVGIALFKENIDWLQSAISYLKSF